MALFLARCRMDTNIANARLPYGAPKKPLPENLAVYNEKTSPVFERAGFYFARNDAANALLLIALALRAFQAEKRRLPQSLKELAPSYLKQVPIDPFRKSDSEYSLYSVGPDAKDDGGRMPRKINVSSRIQPIQLDSRGDIVFGVNS
jgi:hypothetical protein